MIETFAALLLAHVLADFVLQTGAMVARKRAPGILLLHALIVLATAQAALGRVDAWELLLLAAVHAATDAAKAALPRGLAAFLGDQAAHLLALAALAAWRPDLWAGGIWAGLGGGWLPAAFAATAGLLLATRAGGFAVGLLMERYSGAALPPGLQDGGRTIGVLERGLIFLFILAGQPAGIGFLIAAKSVLRFETTKGDTPAGEYVIIGTLASFGWGIAAAYATAALLAALGFALPGS